MSTQQHKGWIVRLLLGFLLPVLCVVLIMAIIGLFNGEKNILKFLAAAIVFGYYFMGIQSAIYSLVMEFLVNRRLAKDHYVLLTGTFLGLLSGFTFWDGSFKDLNFMQVLGALAGFACAWLLRWHFKRSNPVLAELSV